MIRFSFKKITSDRVQLIITVHVSRITPRGFTSMEYLCTLLKTCQRSTCFLKRHLPISIQGLGLCDNNYMSFHLWLPRTKRETPKESRLVFWQRPIWELAMLKLQYDRNVWWCQECGIQCGTWWKGGRKLPVRFVSESRFPSYCTVWNVASFNSGVNFSARRAWSTQINLSPVKWFPAWRQLVINLAPPWSSGQNKMLVSKYCTTYYHAGLRSGFM